MCDIHAETGMRRVDASRLSRVFDLEKEPPTREHLDNLRGKALVAKLLGFVAPWLGIFAIIGVFVLAWAVLGALATRPLCEVGSGIISTLKLMFAWAAFAVAFFWAGTRVATTLSPVDPKGLGPISMHPEELDSIWRAASDYLRTHEEAQRYFQAIGSQGREPVLGEVFLLYLLEEEKARQVEASRDRDADAQSALDDALARSRGTVG